MFRLVGLHPGHDITVPAAARLADLPPNQARQGLGELTRAHLLTEHTPGRYAFHDLLRTYTIQLASTHDSQQDQQAALTRLFDHYLHTAAAAMGALHPDGQRHSAHLPPLAMPALQFTDSATAQHWLDTERGNLIAIVAYCAAHGWHTHTIQLANTVLLRFLEIGGPYRGGPSPDTLALLTHVRNAAYQTGDFGTEAVALIYLGLTLWYQGRYQQAAEHYQQALAICREIGDRASEPQILNGLGETHYATGEFEQARSQHNAALALATELGDRYEQARAHRGLAHTHHTTGDLEPAHHHEHQARTLFTTLGVPDTNSPRSLRSRDGGDG